MSRIRTIHPDLLYSESLSRVSLEAELLWPRLLLLPDDYGRARADMQLIAARLFPRRPGLDGLITMWLDEFERENMIERYRIDDVLYLRVVNWRKYQRVDRPTQSKLPASPQELAKAREASRGRDRTAGKGLENNDNVASSEFAREPENLPRKADGTLDVDGDWLLECVVGEMVAARAEGNRDHFLRAASMAGRLIGWAGTDKAGKRPSSGSAAPSPSPSTPPPHELVAAANAAATAAASAPPS